MEFKPKIICQGGNIIEAKIHTKKYLMVLLWFSVEFAYNQKLMLKSKKNYYIEHCPLPEDTVDQLNIN